MEQLGHANARLTQRIYARVMSSDADERERLRAFVQGDLLALAGNIDRHGRQSSVASAFKKHNTCPPDAPACRPCSALPLESARIRLKSG